MDVGKALEAPYTDTKWIIHNLEIVLTRTGHTDLNFQPPEPRGINYGGGLWAPQSIVLYYKSSDLLTCTVKPLIAEDVFYSSQQPVNISSRFKRAALRTWSNHMVCEHEAVSILEWTWTCIKARGELKDRKKAQRGTRKDKIEEIKPPM